MPEDRGWMSVETLEEIPRYLLAHNEIREVLVSGGDPLTASDARLAELFSLIRAGRSGIRIRLCTRIPISLPQRITDSLISLLGAHTPLHLIVHINHPREISKGFIEGIQRVHHAGIVVRSQSVLLRGINDSADTLEELFIAISQCGIDPYYLFQGDLATGTSHFRTPLSKGLDIYRELRRRLSGLELPRYAVDAPGGGGKLYLPESVRGREGNTWLLEAPDGSIHRYPEEP
jgi:lysine 2,3-aminomutase